MNLPRDAQMPNTMAGYMDNLVNAVGVDSGKFTAVNKRLAEITTTLKSLAESKALFAATVTKKSKELCSLRQQLNKTKQSGGGGRSSPCDTRVSSWVRGKYRYTHSYGVGKTTRAPRVSCWRQPRARCNGVKHHGWLGAE